jgi:hypothetical protein
LRSFPHNYVPKVILPQAALLKIYSHFHSFKKKSDRWTGLMELLNGHRVLAGNKLAVLYLNSGKKNHGAALTAAARLRYNSLFDLMKPITAEDKMMRLFAPGKKSARVETISDILVGFAIVMKGVDKAEHFSRHPLAVIFMFCAGAFIVLGAVFRHGIEKRLPNFSALFHVAEGVALVLVGLLLLERSTRLPYFFLFIGAVYLAVGGYEWFTGPEQKRRLRPLFLAVLGTVFLLAALVFSAFNFFNSRDTWAYIASGVIAATGLFLLLVRRKAAG